MKIFEQIFNKEHFPLNNFKPKYPPIHCIRCKKPTHNLVKHQDTCPVKPKNGPTINETLEDN